MSVKSVGFICKLNMDVCLTVRLDGIGNPWAINDVSKSIIQTLYSKKTI